jgi:hypothetical protein
MAEELIVVEEKRRQQASSGLHHGELTEVKNYGLVPDFNGEKKLRGGFGWELQDEKDADGKNIVIYESFNLTIEKKSRLRKILTEILGHEPDDKIVLNQLIGTECNLIVQHNHKNGEVYANIEGHFPLQPGSTTSKAKSQPFGGTSAGTYGAKGAANVRKSKSEIEDPTTITGKDEAY